MTGAPCRGCGVATTGPTVSVPFDAWGQATRLLGTCAACLTLDFDRPGAAVRATLRLLRRRESDDAVAAAAFREAGLDVAAVLYESRRDTAPQERAWGHVTADDRALLRAAYLRVLDALVRPPEAAPEGPTPPPSGRACLACGVPRSDGWSAVRTAALTRGPAQVDGHLCRVCSGVLGQVGALGPTFLERAVLEAKGLPWEPGLEVPGLRAWAATGREPCEPWSWVSVRMAEPEPDPVDALRAQVADLVAEVAALRAAT